MAVDKTAVLLLLLLWYIVHSVLLSSFILTLMPFFLPSFHLDDHLKKLIEPVKVFPSQLSSIITMVAII